MVMKIIHPFALPVVLVLLLLAGPAHARTLYVNGSSSPGDGSSWASPLTSLTDALDQAAPGDQIWVAQGIYLPTTDADRAATFRLHEGVEIYGGFAGNETELTKRDVTQYPTILSGDIGSPGVPDDNVFHVVTATENGVLDGFTISGGFGADMGWKGRDRLTAADVASGYHQGIGAGMLIFHAAPEVRHCVFQDNHAIIGGGVYVMSSPADTPTAPAPASPRFLDCVFWQNSALAHGGGAANFLRTNPLFVSCVFDSNIADIKGGGMFNDFGAAPRLLNTLFRNNEAETGGGIANDGGSQPVLFYSTLTGNRALKSGPAVYQSGGQPNTTVLLKTIVWDNECDCPDKRFFNGEPSVVRVRESVIQGGYKGKSVFQANPGLDRKSETLLNTGYKTNGHRFRNNKLTQRLKDVARYEEAGSLPPFDPNYVAMVAPRLLNAATATPAPEPVVMSMPKPEPKPMPKPKTEASPVTTPEPASTSPSPLPTTPPAPHAEPLVITPAPTATEHEPETVAMVAPQNTPATPEPAARLDSPPRSEAAMEDLDLDGNGFLTINEVSGPLQQNFWRVDNNGDGCVSQTELERFETGRKKETQKAKAPHRPVQSRPSPQTASAKAPTPVASVQQPRNTSPAKVEGIKPSTDSSTGYTLFAPIGGRETYLIDTSGNVVKQWTGADRSSGAVYLLNNGNLLRNVTPKHGELRTPFDGPGVTGGIIQEVSPRGQVVWEYAYASKDVRQHHDIAPMPNGNVLLLAWELKTQSDIAAAGGSVRNHPDNQIWAEHIVEVRKSGPRSGIIVWEWHSWDHLVQNSDQDAPNFASPSRLPQRIDLNHNPLRSPDWHHADSIDYNPVANQILVSVRNINEIWIIDHSTTSSQAASNTGGIMHRGGDLLLRWGNPATWGGTGRQVLFGQHDATWITGTRPGEETILIFNNGDRRTGKSDVIEIKPAYYFKSTRLEADVIWSYAQQGGTPFLAEHGSGAQRLQNGNTLICDGTGARLFEVNPKGRTVWEYSHKPSGAGSGSRLFRATRIQSDHPGLLGLGLR